MTYILRTKSGEAKVVLTNTKAQFLINNCKGHFRQANYGKSGVKTVFKFDSDMVFGELLIHGFEIFIWVGDVLEPRDN